MGDAIDRAAVLQELQGHADWCRKYRDGVPGYDLSAGCLEASKRNIERFPIADLPAVSAPDVAELVEALRRIGTLAPIEKPPEPYDERGWQIADTGERHAQMVLAYEMWLVADFARGTLAKIGGAEMTEHLASIIIGTALLSGFVGFWFGFWIGSGDGP